MKGELQSPPRTAWGLRDVQDVLPAAKAVRLLGGSPFRGLQDEMPRRRQSWLMAWYQFCRMSSQACVLACCLTHPCTPSPRAGLLQALGTPPRTLYQASRQAAHAIVQNSVHLQGSALCQAPHCSAPAAAAPPAKHLPTSAMRPVHEP